MKECRAWESDADRAGIRAATAGQGGFSPMEVAEFLVADEPDEEEAR